MSAHNVKKDKSAFTLIELMVGMGIVALLIGMSVFGIQLLQRNARDTQRRKTGEAFALIMEEFSAANGQYPTNAQVQILADEVTVNYPGGASESVPLDGAVGAANEASDTDSTAYCYDVNTSGSEFTFGYQLEGSGGTWENEGDYTACATVEYDGT
ncbi:MAG: type II secretion system protein [Candidatus Dojkabacteria bacterium]|nr:type II secretion system protein [Candidatus Dojkabacteria bacterium]MDQ7020461.1 type II secretion system protein [Candidatus Dojkabacteria bacterium]